jgi:hypothetical protein
MVNDHAKAPLRWGFVVFVLTLWIAFLSFIGYIDAKVQDGYYTHHKPS